jgi:hypothetical protein
MRSQGFGETLLALIVVLAGVWGLIAVVIWLS